MGQEDVNLPKTPAGWAIHLSQMLAYFHDVHGLDRFPIKVETIAREFSQQAYPSTPITAVEGGDFNDFEGALVPSPRVKGEWGIFYNKSLSSKGRINFTLAHELGHYLLHRHLISEPKYCAKDEMWAWDSAYRKMESEANQFASYLLMPMDDFREQVSGITKPTVSVFDQIRKRYDTSLTAAILKWLEFTTRRAMVVVSKDGFIDWSWSSKPLIKSGVFYRARQVTTPIPDRSIASGKRNFLHPEQGEMLPKGVWANNEEVYESAIFSEYHGMAISLLIYPSDPPSQFYSRSDGFEEPEEFDTFDQFQKNSRVDGG